MWKSETKPLLETGCRGGGPSEDCKVSVKAKRLEEICRENTENIGEVLITEQ